jgi:hypothetical protein
MTSIKRIGHNDRGNLATYYQKLSTQSIQQQNRNNTKTYFLVFFHQVYLGNGKR